jgi:hypothetical protein
LDSTNSKDEKSHTGSCSNSMVIESDWFSWSFEFSYDHDHHPIVGVNVGVLYPATSIRDTRRRVDSGGSPNLEIKGMHEDTRHKIYTSSGSQSSVPYILFE